MREIIENRTGNPQLGWGSPDFLGSWPPLVNWLLGRNPTSQMQCAVVMWKWHHDAAMSHVTWVCGQLYHRILIKKQSVACNITDMMISLLCDISRLRWFDTIHRKVPSLPAWQWDLAAIGFEMMILIGDFDIINEEVLQIPWVQVIFGF